MTTVLKDVQPRAQAALASSPFFELRGLRVESSNCAMVISGCVTSYYHKQVAQEVVRSVCKDTEVVNRIQVKGEEEIQPQDTSPPT
ncbi:MAG: BON domain-containing protein [Thermoguttaceae bacterium]